jgi:hypothetical protein
MTKPRCPFEFKVYCTSACAWFNKEGDKCQLLLTVSELSNAIKDTNELVRGVAGSLRTLISRENKNDLSR